MNGTEAVTVTVTAELADGFEWGQLGYVFSTHVNNNDRDIDAGVARGVVRRSNPGGAAGDRGGVCRGVLSEPSLVSADTDGVTYTVEPEGPYLSGHTVIVTATLAASWCRLG